MSRFGLRSYSDGGFKLSAVTTTASAEDKVLLKPLTKSLYQNSSTQTLQERKKRKKNVAILSTGGKSSFDVCVSVQEVTNCLDAKERLRNTPSTNNEESMICRVPLSRLSELWLYKLSGTTLSCATNSNFVRCSIKKETLTAHLKNKKAEKETERALMLFGKESPLRGLYIMGDDDRDIGRSITTDIGTSSSVKLMCLYCDKKFTSLKMQAKHVDKIHTFGKDRRCSGRNLHGGIADTTVFGINVANNSASVPHASARITTTNTSANRIQYFPGCTFCAKSISVVPAGAHSASVPLLASSSQRVNHSLATTDVVKDLNGLFLHMTECHADKYFGCRECVLRFQNAEKFAQHMKAVHQVRATTNTVCDPHLDGAPVDCSPKPDVPINPTVFQSINNQPSSGKVCKMQSTRMGKQVPTNGKRNPQLTHNSSNAAATTATAINIAATACATVIPPGDTSTIGADEPILSRLGLTQNRLPNNRRGMRLRRDSAIPNLTDQLAAAAAASSTVCSTAGKIRHKVARNLSYVGAAGIGNFGTSIGCATPCSSVGIIHHEATEVIFRVPTRSDTLSCHFIDEDFYKDVVANVRMNLLHHIDGRIEARTDISLEPATFTNTFTVHSSLNMDYSTPLSCADKFEGAISDISELHAATSLPASTAFPTLLTADQYGGTDASTTKMRRRPHTKHSWKWKWDSVKKFKLVNEGGRIVKKMKQPPMVGLRDLTKLDMWTQLTMREKQKATKGHHSEHNPAAGFDATNPLTSLTTKSPTVVMTTANVRKILTVDGNIAEDVTCCHSDRQRLNEQLNTILDKRLLPHIIVEQNEQTLIKLENEESGADVCGCFVDAPIRSSVEHGPIGVCSGRTISDSDGILRCTYNDDQFMSLLQLLPVRDRRHVKQRIVMSGEWARPRCYLCMCCGAKFDKLKTLEEHKMFRHSHILATHYEVVGRELLAGNLLRHLFIPIRALSRYGSENSSGIVMRTHYSGSISSIGVNTDRKVSVVNATVSCPELRETHSTPTMFPGEVDVAVKAARILLSGVEEDESSASSIHSILTTGSMPHTYRHSSSSSSRSSNGSRRGLGSQVLLNHNSSLEEYEDADTKTVVKTSTTPTTATISQIHRNLTGIVESNLSASMSLSSLSSLNARVTVSCTKCRRQCSSITELYRHMLDCSGDYVWSMVKKRKYRYYCGSKKRRHCHKFNSYGATVCGSGVTRLKAGAKTPPRSPIDVVMPSVNDTEESNSSKAITKTPLRQKPGDAETIKKMLENLPAKRVCKKIFAIPTKQVREAKTISNMAKRKLTAAAVAAKHKMYDSQLAAAAADTKAAKAAKMKKAMRQTRARHLSQKATKLLATKAKNTNPKNVNSKSSKTANTSGVCFVPVFPRKAAVAAAAAMAGYATHNKKQRQMLNTLRHPKGSCQKIAVVKLMRSVSDSKDPPINIVGTTSASIEMSMELAEPDQFRGNKPDTVRVDTPIISHMNKAGQCFGATNCIDPSIDATRRADSDSEHNRTVKTLGGASISSMLALQHQGEIQSQNPMTLIITPTTRSQSTTTFANSGIRNSEYIVAHGVGSKKRSKKINDCIAMLTGKLEQKLKTAPAAKVDVQVDSVPHFTALPNVETPDAHDSALTSPCPYTADNNTSDPPLLPTTNKGTLQGAVTATTHGEKLVGIINHLNQYKTPKRKTISRRFIKVPLDMPLPIVVSDSQPEQSLQSSQLISSVASPHLPLSSIITQSALTAKTPAPPLSSAIYSQLKSAHGNEYRVKQIQQFAQVSIPSDVGASVLNVMTSPVSATIQNFIPQPIVNASTANSTAINVIDLNLHTKALPFISMDIPKLGAAKKSDVPQFSIPSVPYSTATPKDAYIFDAADGVSLGISSIKPQLINSDNVSTDNIEISSAQPQAVGLFSAIPLLPSVHNTSTLIQESLPLQPALSQEQSSSIGSVALFSTFGTPVSNHVMMLPSVVHPPSLPQFAASPPSSTALGYGGNEPLNLSSSYRSPPVLPKDIEPIIDFHANRIIPARRQTIGGSEAPAFLLHDENEPLDLTKNRNAPAAPKTQTQVKPVAVNTVISPKLPRTALPEVFTERIIPGKTVSQFPLISGLGHTAVILPTRTNTEGLKLPKSFPLQPLSLQTELLLSKQFYSNLELLKIPQVRNPAIYTPTSTLPGRSVPAMMNAPKASTIAASDESAGLTIPHTMSQQPHPTQSQTDVAREEVPECGAIAHLVANTCSNSFLGTQPTITTVAPITVAAMLAGNKKRCALGKETTCKNKQQLKMDEQVINHIDDAINSVINAVNASMTAEDGNAYVDDNVAPATVKKDSAVVNQSYLVVSTEPSITDMSSFQPIASKTNVLSAPSVVPIVAPITLPLSQPVVNVDSRIPLGTSVSQNTDQYVSPFSIPQNLPYLPEFPLFTVTNLTPLKRGTRAKTLDSRPTGLGRHSPVIANIAISEKADCHKNPQPPSHEPTQELHLTTRPVISSPILSTNAMKLLPEDSDSKQEVTSQIIQPRKLNDKNKGLDSRLLASSSGIDKSQLKVASATDAVFVPTSPAMPLNNSLCIESTSTLTTMSTVQHQQQQLPQPNAQQEANNNIHSGVSVSTEENISNATNSANNNNTTSSGFYSSAQSLEDAMNGLGTGTAQKKQRRRRKNELAAIVADQLLESFKIDKVRRDNLKKLENLAYEKSEDLLLTGMLLMSSTKRSTAASSQYIVSTLGTSERNKEKESPSAEGTKRSKAAASSTVLSKTAAMASKAMGATEESGKEARAALGSACAVNPENPITVSQGIVQTVGSRRRQTVSLEQPIALSKGCTKFFDTCHRTKLKSSLESFSIGIERQLAELQTAEAADGKAATALRIVASESSAGTSAGAAAVSITCPTLLSSIHKHPRATATSTPSATQPILAANACHSRSGYDEPGISDVIESKLSSSATTSIPTTLTTLSSRDPRLNKNIHKEGEVICIAKIRLRSATERAHRHLETVRTITVAEEEDDNYLTEIAKKVNARIMSAENEEEFDLADDGFALADRQRVGADDEDDSNSKFYRPPTSMSAPNFNDDRSNIDSTYDDENTNTEVMDMDLDDEMSVYTSFSQDHGRGGGTGRRRRRRRRSILLSRRRSKKRPGRNLSGEKFECTLCNKIFFAAHSLTKHNMTLAHVSKLSEQEYLLSKSVVADTFVAIPMPFQTLTTSVATTAEKVCPSVESTEIIPPMSLHSAASQKTNTIVLSSTQAVHNQKPLRNEKQQLPTSDSVSTPRLTLNPDERLFYECCSILKSAENPRHNVLPAQSPYLSYTTNEPRAPLLQSLPETMSVYQPHHQESSLTCSSLTDDVIFTMAPTSQKSLPLVVDGRSLGNHDLLIPNTAVTAVGPSHQAYPQHPEYTLLTQPASHLADHTQLHMSHRHTNMTSIRHGRNLASPNHSIVSQFSGVTNMTTSRFKTKAAMKGYENVRLSGTTLALAPPSEGLKLHVQQIQPSGLTLNDNDLSGTNKPANQTTKVSVCKLTELADIALGSEKPPVNSSPRSLYATFKTSEHLRRDSMDIDVDYEDNTQRCRPLVKRSKTNTSAPRGGTSYATSREGTSLSDVASARDQRDNFTIAPPILDTVPIVRGVRTCCNVSFVRHDRSKHIGEPQSSSSKTRMHSSIIKTAVEKHQHGVPLPLPQPQTQSISKIVIPDRPFKNIGLEEKASITFQKPRTTAALISNNNDNNSVSPSSASYSDRDDFDFNSINSDDDEEEDNLNVIDRNDKPPHRNKSDNDDNDNCEITKEIQITPTAQQFGPHRQQQNLPVLSKVHNSSESSSSRDTIKTLENKSLIMGRIFKNASSAKIAPGGMAKAVVTSAVTAIGSGMSAVKGGVYDEFNMTALAVQTTPVNVKNVGAQNDHPAPPPKAAEDLDQLFDKLRDVSPRRTGSIILQSRMSRTKRRGSCRNVSTIVSTAPEAVVTDYQSIITEVPVSANLSKTEDHSTVVNQPLCNKSIGVSNKTKRGKNAGTSGISRRPTQKAHKNVSKLQTELGMSQEEVEQLIDEGQRKSKRRCATNHPKKMVEMWSSDEYEEFLSTKDIIALIAEKEKQEQKRKRKNTIVAVGVVSPVTSALDFCPDVGKMQTLPPTVPVAGSSTKAASPHSCTPQIDQIAGTAPRRRNMRSVIELDGCIKHTPLSTEGELPPMISPIVALLPTSPVLSTRDKKTIHKPSSPLEKLLPVPDPILQRIHGASSERRAAKLANVRITTDSQADKECEHQRKKRVIPCTASAVDNQKANFSRKAVSILAIRSNGNIEKNEQNRDIASISTKKVTSKQDDKSNNNNICSNNNNSTPTIAAASEQLQTAVSKEKKVPAIEREVAPSLMTVQTLSSDSLLSEDDAQHFLSVFQLDQSLRASAAASGRIARKPFIGTNTPNNSRKVRNRTKNPERRIRKSTKKLQPTNKRAESKPQSASHLQSNSILIGEDMYTATNAAVIGSPNHITKQCAHRGIVSKQKQQHHKTKGNKNAAVRDNDLHQHCNRPKRKGGNSNRISPSRHKRASTEKLYYWSSSSEEFAKQPHLNNVDTDKDVVEINDGKLDHTGPSRRHNVCFDCDGGSTDDNKAGNVTADIGDGEHYQQKHGWIVGDSHKKLVTLLAITKGGSTKNIDNCVVKQKNGSKKKV